MSKGHKPSDLLATLQHHFEEHADCLRAAEQQRYMKSVMPYWGVTLPQVRKMSDQLFKEYAPSTNEEYRRIILYLFKNAQCREEWYAGLHYAKKFKKFIGIENLELYLELIRLTQWWDIVDDAAVHLVGGSLKTVDDIKIFLQSWIVDENMWIRRTALLAQLKYKNATDSVLLSKLILSVINEKEFFIRKAIGWVLREYSYTNPEWVKSFIKEHEKELSGLSIREGLKAIKRKEKRKT